MDSGNEESSASNRRNCFFLIAIVITFLAAPTAMVVAQETTVEPAVEPAVEVDPTETEIETPDRVEVDPLAEDQEISSRLARIFEATGWFDSIGVTTDEGVVFLTGFADNESHRAWAERVAQRTSDVVAVVNRMQVRSGPVWDVRPAVVQLQMLGRDFVQLLPLLVVGFFVVLVAYGFARLAASSTRRLTARRIDSQLLQQVVASVVAVLVMLVGLYIALKVSGLSRLAVTVLGGTGLVGLALGFAFRDIAENYLASILISLNRPFNVGDLIELDNYKGFVRRVTTRGTLLLTAEGNHIQIPNAMVYKSVVTNFSSSPRVRKKFTVGIGYDDSVAEAQEVLHQTILSHESVLDDPAPLVLVESLGASTVNLTVLFWLDSERFDAASVSSALMRQAKTALTEANISMPDEAREVVFPNGVPVAMLDKSNQSPFHSPVRDLSPDGHARKEVDHSFSDDKVHATNAEGELANSDEKVQDQAKDAELPLGENLID